MRDSFGNILKVVHKTNCTVEVAKEALANNNTWPDTFKYAQQRTEN